MIIREMSSNEKLAVKYI